MAKQELAHVPVTAVWLDPRDDVATALRAIEAGERVRVRCADRVLDVTAREAVALGHKLALRDIARGVRVRKYGDFVGRATADIPQGGWVHTHNLATAAQRSSAEDLAWRAQAAPARGVRVAACMPPRDERAAWSRDGAKRYAADPARGFVYAEPEGTGTAVVFADAGGLPGEPVDAVVDAHDHVWVALHDAGSLLRYAPDGTLVRVLRLPVSCPTTLAIADDEIYVATTREGLSPSRLAGEPLAGAVLVASLREEVPPS